MISWDVICLRLILPRDITQIKNIIFKNGWKHVTFHWFNGHEFFFSFIFISWRLITLRYCSGFCHTLTWISHGFTCIPHPDPPSHLPLYLILLRQLAPRLSPTSLGWAHRAPSTPPLYVHGYDWEAKSLDQCKHKLQLCFKDSFLFICNLNKIKG